MEKIIETVRVDAENGKVLSVWVGRGDSLTRLPGQFDALVIASHACGADKGAWSLSFPVGADDGGLVHVLIECLRKYQEERKYAPTSQPASKPEQPATRSEKHVIPFPKGMTPEQIAEFSAGIDKVFKTKEPPR